ncbi:MAG: flagellar hook-length control protein FliK [Candidatus Hydrogenedentota bacterium]|nr:MAG: flagellar hook-length control protein FliK [Candidatus Hydrogenedentota bacterium]
MPISGAGGSRSFSPSIGKIVVREVDAAAIKARLSVGSRLSARVLQSHGKNLFTIGFAGMRMLAESDVPLSVGMRLSVLVASLEPKIHLRLTPREGRNAAEILGKFGIRNPSPELIAAAKEMIALGLPFEPALLSAVRNALDKGYTPRQAALSAARGYAVTKEAAVRAAAARDSLTQALSALTEHLQNDGLESTAAAIEKAFTFRGDLRSFLEPHPLRLTRRLLSLPEPKEPESLQRFLETLRNLERRFRDTALEEGEPEMSRTLDRLLSEDLGGSALSPIASEDLEHLSEILIGRERFLEARALLRFLPADRRREALALRLRRLIAAERDPGADPRAPETARLASDLLAEILAGPSRNASATARLENLVTHLINLGRTRQAGFLEALFNPETSGTSAREPIELLMTLADGKSTEPHRTVSPETARAAQHLLAVAEGQFLLGEPEPAIPFLSEDDEKSEGRLSADRAPEITYLRFRLSPTNLGPLVGVMDVRRKTIGLSLGSNSDKARKALRSALPDLHRSLAALGFHLESATVEPLERGREASSDAIPFGFDVKI